MTRATFEAEVDAAVEERHGLRKAAAHKRGRNPRWPYVPVLLVPLPYVTAEYLERNNGRLERYDYRQEQLRGLAYATREEALAVAERKLEQDRAHMRAAILDPVNGRAWRTFLGLPRDLDEVGP